MSKIELSKIELSKWQNSEDGFPSEDYFDAVIVALENAGVGVMDSWRTEPHEFVMELNQDSLLGGPHWNAHDLAVCWRVSEESDPLRQTEDEEWHGFHGVGQLPPGWYWMRCKETGEGVSPAFLPHPQSAISPMDPVEEPEVVAAAVAALVRGGSDQEATKKELTDEH